jgi:hypothetical protein
MLSTNLEGYRKGPRSTPLLPRPHNDTERLASINRTGITTAFILSYHKVSFEMKEMLRQAIYTVGLMFWLSWKKLVGSYLALRISASPFCQQHSHELYWLECNA